MSVIVPVYNREHLIQRALKSLLTQDLDAPYEIIVVDDGSDDQTCGQVASLQASAPHLRLVRQPNLGAAVARHRGVLEAQSPIVTFQDSDDVSTNNRLRILLESLRHCPEASAVVSLSATLAAPEQPNPPVPSGQGGMIASPLEVQLRSGRPVVSGMNIATFRSLALEASGDRAFYRAANDYDFFLRLAAKGPFAIAKQITLLYELQDQGISQMNGKHYGRTAAYALAAAADAVHYCGSDHECLLALRALVERTAPKTLVRLWQGGSDHKLLLKIGWLTLVHHRWHLLPINLLRAWRRHHRRPCQ